MNTLEKKFQQMGATIEVHPRRMGAEYTIDVRKGKFIIGINAALKGLKRITVLDQDKADRHILLLVETHDRVTDKYLCGHDERDWFVASIKPGSVKNIKDAKESLKPDYENNL